MTRTTDTLNELSGHAAADHPASGTPGRLWAGDVTVVNQDGTVDVQPITGRATKVAVPTPAWYANPHVGDRVLLTDLNGDPRNPVVLIPWQTTPPVVTGSRAGNAALGSLCAALDDLGLIDNQTT